MTMHSSSNTKLSCPENAARAVNHAEECSDLGMTLPRQLRNQHAASNLTETQDRALFSGEGLVWRESNVRSFWTVRQLHDQPAYRHD